MVCSCTIINMYEYKCIISNTVSPKRALTDAYQAGVLQLMLYVNVSLGDVWDEYPMS